MNTPYETPHSNLSAPIQSTPRKRLKSISPVKAGIVLGALYAVLVFLAFLIIIPFGLSGLIAGGARGGSSAFGMGIGALILAPIIYGILGFIGGVIAAWVYNFIAKLTGGLEFTLEDVQY